MKYLEEFHAAIDRIEVWYRFTDKVQTVFMIIFIDPAFERKAMLLILDITPQDMAQGAQRIYIETFQWVNIREGIEVLETEADGIHGLYKHALVHPVTPEHLYREWPADEFIVTRQTI